MTRPRFAWTSSLVLALAGLASVAGAAPGGSTKDAIARALYEAAVEDHRLGNDAAACAKLEEVVVLMPGWVGAKLTLAECYESLDRLASAWATYAQAAAAAIQATRPSEASQASAHVEELRPRLARLTVLVSPSAATLDGLEIQRDEVPVGAAQWGVPLPVDKGRHAVTAIAKGKRRWRTIVQVRADGVDEAVSIADLIDEAPPPRPPSPPMTIDVRAYIGVSVRVDAPPEGFTLAPRSDVTLGGAVFVTPVPRFSFGAAYEHAGLGQEVASGRPIPFDVSRSLDALWSTFWLHPFDADRLRLSMVFGAGPAWQHAEGSVFALTPLVGDPRPVARSCSTSDSARLGLRVGVGAELLLGNGFFFFLDSTIDHLRLTADELVVDSPCALSGAGATTLLTVRGGLLRRFDLR